MGIRKIRTEFFVELLLRKIPLCTTTIGKNSIELFVVMVGNGLTLDHYGFDPEKILVKAPPKIDPEKEKQDINFETQHKYNLCEFEQCLKKAVGHFGQINLCWDHGQHLEKNFSSWKKEWRFIYWRSLDKRLSK